MSGSVTAADVKVPHASTARTASGTSHLASDATGSLIPATNTFGLLSKRTDPQLSVI